jgi:hypothetical protein
LPVLSFPCVIHRLRDAAPPTHHRTWIKGHDFRTLALAATRQLGVPHEECEYTLVVRESIPDAAFLEVVHAFGSVLVGAMAAPLPPRTMTKERRFPLNTLLQILGFEPPDQVPGSLVPGADVQYLVLVTYVPLSESNGYPPVREHRETDRHFYTRKEAAERQRLERSRHQGMYMVHYDVPPEHWTAHDLEMLLGLGYRLLPTDEPRWRESGAIRPAKFVNPRDGRITISPCLQVSRGDYIAHLQLPMFPTFALAEWLEHRHYDINLRHPLIKSELVRRGWRCDDRLTVGTPPAPSDASLALA